MLLPLVAVGCHLLANISHFLFAIFLLLQKYVVITRCLTVEHIQQFLCSRIPILSILGINLRALLDSAFVDPPPMYSTRSCLTISSLKSRWFLILLNGSLILIYINNADFYKCNKDNSSPL